MKGRVEGAEKWSQRTIKPADWRQNQTLKLCLLTQGTYNVLSLYCFFIKPTDEFTGRCLPLHQTGGQVTSQGSLTHFSWHTEASLLLPRAVINLYMRLLGGLHHYYSIFPFPQRNGDVSSRPMEIVLDLLKAINNFSSSFICAGTPVRPHAYTWEE